MQLKKPGKSSGQPKSHNAKKRADEKRRDLPR
jgi:hypothetical protein